MTIELTTDGLTVETLAQIKAELEAEQKENISPALDLSSTSVLGQLNSIFANKLAELEEALAAVYLAMDPLAANGDALDRIAAFNGVFRQAATKSQLSCSVFFSQTGTFTSQSLLANPVGSESSLFENVHDIVVSSAPFTASNVLFRAIDTGPTRVILGSSGSGTLTEQANSVVGWDGLFGSSSLFIGENSESDTDLRLRRLQELFKAGTTSVNGIVSEISTKVSGADQVSVYENTSSTPDVDGIPPYAIETVVFGPSAPDADIATTLFDAKAAGTPTFGNTSYEVADSNGGLHTIFFTRPVEVPLSMSINLTFQAGSSFGGATAVQQTVITNATASWTPGLDVAPSQVSCWVQAIDGVLSVDSVTVGGLSTRYPIDIRQIAVITSSADITVTATQGTP